VKAWKEAQASSQSRTAAQASEDGSLNFRSENRWQSGDLAVESGSFAQKQ
jgi:hypothetical protein